MPSKALTTSLYQPTCPTSKKPGCARHSIRQVWCIKYYSAIQIFHGCLEFMQTIQMNHMKHSRTAGIQRSMRLLLIVISGMLILAACTPVPLPISHQNLDPCRSKHRVGFFSTLHGGLVDASGCKVVLTGVNWFGFEEASFAPHGLHVRNYRDM